MLGLALSLASRLSSLGTAGAARAARVGRQQTLALSGDGLVQRPCWVASVCRRLAAPPTAGVPLASWDTWALRPLGHYWGALGGWQAQGWVTEPSVVPWASGRRHDDVERATGGCVSACGRVWARVCCQSGLQWAAVRRPWAFAGSCQQGTEQQEKGQEEGWVNVCAVRASFAEQSCVSSKYSTVHATCS